MARCLNQTVGRRLPEKAGLAGQLPIRYAHKNVSKGNAMLEENRQRIQNLSGNEIWMFIVARVLIGFALGVLAMVYFPSVASQLAWPVLFVGFILFILASRGLFRGRQKGSSR